MPLNQAVEYALAAAESLLTAAPEAPAGDRRPAGLTERELEVAALVARGLTSREIAERLVISERTADTHVDHIRDKLGLHSRWQIVNWANGHGPRTAPAT